MDYESIYGERFVAVPPTPLLSAAIDAARTRLIEVLAPSCPEVTVVPAARLDFGGATVLAPSLVVWRRDPAGTPSRSSPDLVIEFRTESTSRYVLGPKRMVYARHGVPEFWFVDPVRQRLARLAGDEYGWPPQICKPSDVIVPLRFPLAAVACGLVFAAWPADRVREPGPDEPWLEW